MICFFIIIILFLFKWLIEFFLFCLVCVAQRSKVHQSGKSIVVSNMKFGGDPGG